METLSKKERFLKHLRAFVLHRWDNQKKAAKFLQISTPQLSNILAGKKNISPELKQRLSGWMFPAKYWTLLEESQAEGKKRKDEFLLLLEQKDNILLDYKHLLDVHKIWLEKMVKEKEELRYEIIRLRKELKVFQISQNKPEKIGGF